MGYKKCTIPSITQKVSLAPQSQLIIGFHSLKHIPVFKYLGTIQLK